MANATVSSQDRTWLVASHQTNLAEIQAGKLAAQDGHTTAVRNAGRMLVTDHEALDAKLKPVAKELDVKLPDAPNAKQRDTMRKFQSESGMQFDKGWTHAEADGHILAIEMTEREIEHGSDSKVKHLAKAALPVLKKHLHELHHVATEIHGIK